MTVETWLAEALDDARRRNLRELEPLLEGLAEAMRVLRRADFNDRADERTDRRADD
jgi:hypothetical protein